MTTTLASSASTAIRIACTNSPGVSSAGSICCSDTMSGVDVRAASRRPSCPQRVNSVSGLSSKMNERRAADRVHAAATANCAANVDLPVPAAPTMSVLVPSSMPPPSSASSCGNVARQLRARRELPVFGGNQPREHLDAALLDHVVVIAAAEFDAAVLDDAQPAPLGAVFGIQLLEQNDAVRDALHLQVVIGRGHVVEQHHRAIASGEELLQREDLPAIPQARFRPAAAARTASRRRRASASAVRRPRESAWSLTPVPPRRGGTSCSVRRSRAQPRAASTHG